MIGLAFQHQPSRGYNIHQSLEEFPLEKPKPSVVLRAEDVVSSGKCFFASQKCCESLAYSCYLQ